MTVGARDGRTLQTGIVRPGGQARLWTMRSDFPTERRAAGRGPYRAGAASVAAAALVLLALIGAACGGTASSTSLPELGKVSGPPEGAPTGPLSLAGTDPVTGASVRLADYAGTPIVLNFWASWCQPCRKELPALAELSRSHPEIRVVGVNYQDSAASARALQEELGFDFPSIADTDGSLASTLGVIGMPTTFFLDTGHRVVGQVVGGSDLAGFEEGVARAGGG